MPKLGEMAQISRPFQIALLAVCVLAAVWVFALQGKSSNSSSSQSTTVSAPSTPAPTASATTPKRSSLGSAPGLKGLSHAIAKARGAVTTSERNNRQLEEKSARASGESTSASTSAGTSSTPAKSATHPGTTATSGAATHASSSTSTSSAAAPATVKRQPTKSSTAAGRIPTRQALVERALHEGKIAVILFWNPKAADDVAVSHELKLLEAVHHLIRPYANVPKVRKALERSGLELQKKFAAFWATSNELSSFGAITQHVQVAATPTILIVNKSGQTTELTGLQDAFSIEQAIDEARNSHT